MKRMCQIAALMLILVFVLGITVRADVILSPPTEFYVLHREECSDYGRTRIVNSPAGCLIVYESPISDRVVATIGNGTVLYVQVTYENETWGYINFTEGSGWIQLTDTLMKYDNFEFMEEFADEFYQDDEAVKQMLSGLAEEDPVYFYFYPGSGPTGSHSYIPARYIGVHVEVTDLFEDEFGRVWGSTGYTLSNRGGWICISDPTNSELPEIVRQDVDLYPASGIDIQSELTPAWVLPMCLVIGVVVVSFVLILVLKKKKSSGD